MRLRYFFTWLSGLFQKPEEEVVFPKAEIAAWPFPVSEDFAPRPKRKYVRKATTRPVKKKPVAKKATKVAKKAK
jgi:hypothetical protein